MSLKDDCLCGHDRVSHYKYVTPDGVFFCNCLALHCDCKNFRDENTPPVPSALGTDRDLDDAPETPRTSANKPHASVTCGCSACCEWTINKWRGA